MVGPQRLLILNSGGVPYKGSAIYEVPFSINAPQENYKDINTGDTLVLDATLRALNPADVRTKQFGEPLDELLAEWGQPDACVLRGSNYFHEHMDLGPYVAPLEKLNCPVIAIGVGAQASRYGPIKLPEGSVRFLRFLQDRSRSIGVRGDFSADVLNASGIKNVDVIGCPSFYRSMRPKIKVRTANVDTRVGTNYNRYLGGYYCSDPTKTHGLQAALMAWALETTNTPIYWQGEKQELFATRNMDQAALNSVLAAYSAPQTADNRRRFADKIRCFFDIESWVADVRENCDAMIGFRLHGNVISLHQGIPSVMATYDTRTRELVSFFSLPHVEVEDATDMVPDRIIASADFRPFELAYEHNFKRFASFLDANGLHHVIRPHVAE